MLHETFLAMEKLASALASNKPPLRSLTRPRFASRPLQLEGLDAEDDVVERDGVEPEQEAAGFAGGDVDLDDAAHRAAGEGAGEILVGRAPCGRQRSRLDRQALD